MVAATECWDSDDTNTDDSDSEWPAVELDTHRRDFADVSPMVPTLSVLPDDALGTGVRYMRNGRKFSP